MPLTARWGELPFRDPIRRTLIWFGMTPFRAARALYGRYGLGRLVWFRSAMLSDSGNTPVGGDILDLTLERLISARALVAVGLLALVLRFSVDPATATRNFAPWLNGVFLDGLLVMLLAPFAVLLIGLVLLALSRPAYLATRARAMIRPMLGGVLSLLLLILMVPVSLVPEVSEPIRAAARQVTGGLVPIPLFADEVTGQNPLLLVVVVWTMLFFVGAIYLAHRNGLCVSRELPLMPPLVAVLVVWATQLTKLALPLAEAGQLTGWRYVIGAYGAPVTATVIAIAEMVRLRRVHRVGFRGPLPDPG